MTKRTRNEEVEETVEETSEIEVGDPMNIKRDLPLVVKLPKGASSAQVEYAKILNAYAYQNPEKWAKKKELLTKRLHALDGVEVVVPEEQSLAIKGSKVSFSFLKDEKGNEVYVAPSLPVTKE